LTLFELVARSLRKNMKTYDLYFFALTTSVTLYFVFASLQNDKSILSATFGDVRFSSLFQASGLLLLAIVAIFMLYANGIFLKRRSREIGLYQLIGLTRNKVALVLLFENLVLGGGALIVGIVAGALLSRLFLLLLLKLIGVAESAITLSFSMDAAVQTGYVFAALIGLTLLQMLFRVYRATLLDLFRSDRQADHPRQPNQILSAAIGLLGVALIATGYWLSGETTGERLLTNVLIVLASTIFGTYLLFRVTIGWLFYRYRRSRNGQLGLKNSLSLAPMMHRMKANANSLTLITVLSAMTLTMVAFAYSLYYSTENESRAMLPYDFVFENGTRPSESFRIELDKEGIAFERLPIDAVRLRGTIGGGEATRASGLLLLPAERLTESGADVTVPGPGAAVWYKGQPNALDGGTDKAAFPLPVELEGGEPLPFQVAGIADRYAMNVGVNGRQLVVSAATLQSVLERLPARSEPELVGLETYRIEKKSDLAAASGLYARYAEEQPSGLDYYSYAKESLRKFGLILFTAGFLGFIFLIATGSILYFKQMTEAEEERKSFTILRQLGFGEREIMGGVVRKQLFVFAIPLAIGLLHSVFAVKTASALTLSDISFPAAAAMAVYTLVYFLFAALAIGHYRRVVAAALGK